MVWNLKEKTNGETYKIKDGRKAMRGDNIGDNIIETDSMERVSSVS